MKQRIISLALLASVIGATAYGVTAVQAQEANQEQEFEQRSEVNCQTGSYGQGQVCGVTTYQRGRQRQEIVIRQNGAAIQPHQVVNTALDVKMVLIMTGIAALGIASAVGFVKTKQL